MNDEDFICVGITFLFIGLTIFVVTYLILIHQDNKEMLRKIDKFQNKEIVYAIKDKEAS